MPLFERLCFSLRRVATMIASLVVAVLWCAAARAEASSELRTDRQVYHAACASCHGVDGRGSRSSQVGFETPLPDFTDCSFATREPDPDWAGVASEGGPTRGFAPMMPAFGDALSDDEIQQSLDHVRTFCQDGAWPRGELNLPRPMFTEKAYPEDEAVFTTEVDTQVGQGTGGAVMNELLYEKRFGARNQFEVVVPFGWVDTGSEESWVGGIGDLAFAVKRVLAHGLGTGSVVSAAIEGILPTGDPDVGLGGGTGVIEPFLTWGQFLPAEAFLHAQAGAEIPVDFHEQELFVRGALGRTFTQGRWGRAWTPMAEILASRSLESDAAVHLDVVPQVQVSLNTRQHILLNVGARLPLDDSDTRSPQVVAYLLWDWFDGGFLEGW